MRGLIIKDFITAKKTGWSVLLIFVIYAAIAVLTGNLMWSGIGITVLSILPCILVEVDERGNWLKYLFCTPVSKRNYVQVKYGLSIFFGLVAYLITLALWVVRGLALQAFHTDGLFFFTALAVMGTLLPTALSLMLTFHFGAVKGRVVTIFVIAGGGAVFGTVAGTFGKSSVSATAIQDVLVKPTTSIALILLSVAFFAASYFISQAIVAKKEY